MNHRQIPSRLIKQSAGLAFLALWLLVLLFPQARAQQAPAQAKEAARAAAHQGDSSSEAEDEGATPSPSTAEHDSALKASRAAKAYENGFLRFFRGTTVEGFIDTYYSYNFNRPPSLTNTLRAYDVHDRRFSFKAADIAFDKQPTADSRVGFRLDFIFGPAADYLNSEEPGNVRFYRNIHQAYVSYLAPVGHGLRIDAGKFIPWVGAEYDDAGANWNYSHGLLYSLAQPNSHAGLRAKYEFGEKASLMAAFVNGWGNIEENNGGKTFGLSLELKPVSKLSVMQNYIVGPEQPGDSRHLRHLLDTLVSYEFNDRLGVMANYDYGLERLAEGGGARWQGVGAYLRYALTKRIAFGPRFELYNDYDGYTSGTAQRLKELTLTGEYRLNKYALARLEYRRDWSNQPVFERSNPADFARTQATLLGGMIWSFSTRDEKTDAPAGAGGQDAPARSSKPAATENASQTPTHAGPQVSVPRPSFDSISVEEIRTTDSLPEP